MVLLKIYILKSDKTIAKNTSHTPGNILSSDCHSKSIPNSSNTVNGSIDTEIKRVLTIHDPCCTYPQLGHALNDRFHRE